MNIAVTALAALLLAAPLFAMHGYARIYLEPAIEQANDCKDPNSRPGSRADTSIPIPRPGAPGDEARSFALTGGRESQA
jgi:hypothetical protein